MSFTGHLRVQSNCITDLDSAGRAGGQFDDPVCIGHPSPDPRPEGLDVDDLLALQPEHVERHPDEQHMDEPPGDSVVAGKREHRADPGRRFELEDQRVVRWNRRLEHQSLGGLNEAVGDFDVAGENGRSPVALVDQTHSRGIDDRGQNAVDIAGFEGSLVGPAFRQCMLIGAHTSIAGGVDNAVEEQLEYDGNCGQIFSHSPQVWQDPNVGDEEAQRFRERTDQEGVGPWVIHSSYLVNLCTPKDDLRAKSIDSMQKEVEAADKLGVEYVNVHLGAHTGAGVEGGLDNAASALDELEIPEGVTVLIESDAGSGTKLGGEFEHLAAVLDRSEQDLEVCLDTAHAFAAGYDLSTPEAVVETITEFDDVVGLENLACIHLNDSKHACGTNKDEHAHLGDGEIGADGIEAVVSHDALTDVPFVLETPTEDGRGFAWNVEHARELRGES